MKRLLVLVAAATVLAACSSASPRGSLVTSDGTEHGSASASSAPERSVVDSATSDALLDPRPLLTLGFWTYGPAEYWRPKDLEDLYVFPTGSVIRIRLGGVSDDAERSLIAEQISVDDTELQRLITLADAAGLRCVASRALTPSSFRLIVGQSCHRPVRRRSRTRNSVGPARH